LIDVFGLNAPILAFFINPEQTDYLTWDLSHLVRTIGPFPLRDVPPADSGWYPFSEYMVEPSVYNLDFMEKERSKARYKPVRHAVVNGQVRPKIAHPWDSLFRINDERYAIANVVRDSLHIKYGHIARSGDSYPYGAIPLNEFDLPPGDPAWEYPLLVRSTDTLLSNRVGSYPYIDAAHFDTDIDPWLTVHPETGILVPTVLRLAKQLDLTFYRDNRPGQRSVNGKFLNKFVIAEHCAYEDPYDRDSATNTRANWVTDVPYFRAGHYHDTTIMVTHIRNIGTHCELIVHITGYWEVRFTDGTGYKTPVDQYIDDIRLYTTGTRLTTGIPEWMSQDRFNRMVYHMTHLPTAVEQRKTVRTKALIDFGGLEVNNLENISGLQGIGEILKTLKEGYVAFKNLNPRAALRFVANAYLLYKYAIQATGHDVETIRKLGPKTLGDIANPEASFNKRRDTQSFPDPGVPWFETYPKFSAEYILQRNTDIESRIVIALDEIGLLPSASNLWDCVPGSFVVDWFYNLGDVFEALRFDRDTRHYTLIQRIEAQKFTLTCKQAFLDEVLGPNWVPVHAITGKIYERKLYDNWGHIDPLLASGGTGFGWSQTLTSGAMIVQRLA
jgi:hypothetical protein